MDIVARTAREEDLPELVAMLADDELGAQRESTRDLAPYRAAFARIDASHEQLLVVFEDAGQLVGTLQLSFLPGLSHQGATRAQIEAVRVREDRRGGGLGTMMITWAVDTARQHGAAMVQLTSSASRTRAHAFYSRLGFVSSHVGFKLPLDEGTSH